MFFGGIGILGAFGLDMTSKNFKAKADMYKETIQKANQDVLKRQVESEIENKDIKF